MRAVLPVLPVVAGLLVLALGAGCEASPESARDAGADTAGPRRDAGPAGARDATTAADAGADGAAAGDSCTEHEICSPGDYCDRAAGCASSGVCAPRPSTCESTCELVCGCDGVTYRNACEAHLARTTVDAPGACAGFCDPMDAVGTGDRTCPWGFKWDGTACQEVRGCSGCVGADCDLLMTFTECQEYGEACAAADCS